MLAIEALNDSAQSYVLTWRCPEALSGGTTNGFPDNRDDEQSLPPPLAWISDIRIEPSAPGPFG